jgi:hypothetical protein
MFFVISALVFFSFIKLYLKREESRKESKVKEIELSEQREFLNVNIAI